MFSTICITTEVTAHYSHHLKIKTKLSGMKCSLDSNQVSLSITLHFDECREVMETCVLTSLFSWNPERISSTIDTRKTFSLQSYIELYIFKRIVNCFAKNLYNYNLYCQSHTFATINHLSSGCFPFNINTSVYLTLNITGVIICIE